MADVLASERRVLIEDPRGDDIYLRVTWHPEGQQFVVSHWQGSVCLAATRVPVGSAPALVALLARGLGEALAEPDLSVDAPSVGGGTVGVAGRVAAVVARIRSLRRSA